MTEEQRKQHEENKKKYQEAVVAEFAAKAKMVEAVALTEPGKALLRYLHDICGFSASDRVISPGTGEVNLVATALNSERRNVYLQIRALVPAEILRDIEIPLTNKKEEK